MTISTESTRVEYDGDGGTKPFAVPFKFLDKVDLVVLLRDKAAGTDVVQTLTTHYTATGAGAASGTVTFVTAPPTGQRVVIYNDPDLTQLVDYQSGDTFPAETHEEALDRLTLQQKRTRELVERAPRLLEGDLNDGTGTFDANLNRIKNLGVPTANADAATKNYVDSTVTNTVGPIPSGGTYVTATGSTTARTIADRWGEVKNVKDYGAVGDGVTDDTAAIQAAIDSLGADGGTVEIPVGIFGITNTLIVPDKATLAGVGAGSSEIKALGGFTFTGSNAMINMGSGTTLSFSSFLKDLFIDADDKADSICVYSDLINENAGVLRCTVKNFTKYGIHIERNGANSPQNYTLSHLFVLLGASATASTQGIRIEGGSGGHRGMDNITVDSNLSTGGAGIWFDNASAALLTMLHMEGVITGVDIATTGGHAVTILGITGHSSVTTLVRLRSGNHHAIQALNKNGGTNAIVDDVSGVTFTNNLMGFYLAGPDYMGSRLDTGTGSSISVNTAAIYTVTNGGATTLSSLINGTSGQRVTLVFGDANTTVDFTGTTLKGNAGVDWSPAANDHMTCVFDGTNWYCDVSETAQTVFTGSTTHTFGSLASWATSTHSVTCTGATAGMMVDVGLSSQGGATNPGYLILTGHVPTAGNAVVVTVVNTHNLANVLGSGTLTVRAYSN
jgi:hypothetical protein